jgi:hypothetical protein
MQIVELIHRTARRARTGDFTKLSLAEMGDVLQAINTALQEVYNVLPIYFKQMTAGFVLPAPTIVTIGVTNQSTQLTNVPFNLTQFGQTVIIDGDPAWNQITDADKLLNPYMGPTGTVQGTIYGDALYNERYPFDRVVGNPKFADQSQLAIVRREMMNAGAPYIGNLAPSFGRPSNWWTQPFGNSQGNEPLVIIKFFPFPDQAYSVNVDLAFWPKRILLDDYLSNVVIPVPDQFLEPCLIPLAHRALMTTPAYESRGDESLLLDAALRADQFLKLQPGQIGAPANKVLTPIGF